MYLEYNLDACDPRIEMYDTMKFICDTIKGRAYHLVKPRERTHVSGKLLAAATLLPASLCPLPTVEGQIAHSLSKCMVTVFQSAPDVSSGWKHDVEEAPGEPCNCATVRKKCTC